MSRALKTLAVFVVFVVIFTVSHRGHGSAPSALTTVVTSTVTTPSTTTTVLTPVTTTTLPATGATTTTTPTTTTPGTPATTVDCRSGDLRGVFNEGQGAAGTIYASVTLIKATSGACSLKGWPQLTLQSKTGATLTSLTIDLPTTSSPVVFPDARANKPPSILRLAQGGTASFSLAYSDVARGTEVCATATTLGVRVAATGSLIVIDPTYPIQPCRHGTVWVSPFY